MLREAQSFRSGSPKPVLRKPCAEHAAFTDWPQQYFRQVI
jgi:hypothetical protein